MRLNRLRSSLLLVALSATLHAQSYSPKEIRIEGAKAYAPADLLATAGLKQGATISVKEIDAAIQRLADTGLFSDARYAVNPQALTLTLTPVDAKQTLPILYGNFVWWKPGELTPLVHARVPLFNGTVPLNGGLMDSVKQTLVALLAQKGITASVDSMSSTDRPGGPVTALTLMIASPEVKVGEIHFDGAAAAGEAEIAKVAPSFQARTSMKFPRGPHSSTRQSKFIEMTDTLISRSTQGRIALRAPTGLHGS